MVKGNKRHPFILVKGRGAVFRQMVITRRVQKNWVSPEMLLVFLLFQPSILHPDPPQ
jgi:hypothetical protein